MIYILSSTDYFSWGNLFLVATLEHADITVTTVPRVLGGWTARYEELFGFPSNTNGTALISSNGERITWILHELLNSP